jgi:hypothetical protein
LRLRLLGLRLETDRKSCDWVLDLDRKLGLARNGLGDVLLGWGLLLLVVVMDDGMDVVLEWLVKRRKVPKTEMLETHANNSNVFLPRTLYFRR